MSEVDQEQLDVTKEIQRRTGRTFHVATRLLPRRVKEATYVLYAFFRVADEVVDDPDGAPPPEQRAELERIRAAAVGAEETDDPVMSAFRTVSERYGIPEHEVHVFIDAMLMDVNVSEYETYSDLEEYLRGSAVAVAYMMLSLMDPEKAEQARPHAKALGEAFQLTNFLRDVREDILDYDRVYLPLETLGRNGVDREQIERLEFSDGFAEAMRAEMRRTERLYRKGVAGIRYLPQDSQFGVLCAAVLYAEHHRLIREQGFDVLSERPTLTMRRRLTLAARTWIRWKVTADPEGTFYAVSAIEREETYDGDGRDGLETERGWRVTRPARALLDGVRSLVTPR
jgi:phytoene synthase